MSTGADGESELGQLGPLLASDEAVHHLDRADHTDPQARPNYDLWLMRFERRRSGSCRGRSRA